MKLKDETAPKRTSGTGGAHAGMFGRPRMLLEGEDGGGSGGTAPPKDPPKPDEKAGGDKSEKLFTQAELDQHVKDRLARDRKERGQSGQQQPPSKTETKNEGQAANDSKWIFEFTDTIDELVDETGAKLTRAQKSKMRDDFERSRPEDPNAWGKTWFELFGLTKKPDSSSSPNNTPNNGGEGKVPPEKKTGTGPGVSDKGGASGTVLDFETKLNERPLELSQTDIQRLYEKHGEEKACQLIRQSVDRKLSGMKLVADPRRARN